MRTTSLTAAILASSLVVLTACGGGDDGGATDTSAEGAAASSGGVTIEATEFAYSPEDFSLPADVATELTLENKGVVEHDIVVEELDDLELVFANAGETVTETVTIAAGTYTFYCSIPGHRSAGMEGTLTVD
jgi:plastocyanin